MSDKDKEIFDLQVRSIMENASEEVPSHIWDSLDAKLDLMAQNKRKAILFKVLRYSTIALATAAALTLWLIFPKDRSISQTDALPIQIAVVESPVHTDLPKPQDLLALAPRETSKASIATDPQTTAIVENIEAAKKLSQINVVDSEADDNISIASKSQEQTSESAKNQKNTSYRKQAQLLTQGKTPYAKATQMPKYQETDAFDEDLFKKRINTSVVVYGDAVGNAAIRKSSNRAYHMMAPPRPIENKLEEVSESAYSIPITFGVGARIAFTPRWSITAGVNYTILSRSFKGYWFVKDSEGLIVPESAPINITNTQSYIGVPINVYFNIVKAKFLDFYVYAGGTMEKCVENKFKLNDFPKDPRRYSTKGLQWSVNVGLGVEFILTDWLGLYLDPCVRYYFDTNQPKSIRTVQPLSFGCELGLRVRL